MDAATISATEFKAKCLDLLDRVGSHQIKRLDITKRGKVVAVLTAPPGDATAVRRLHGFLRGSVAIPPGMDLTSPVLEEDEVEAAQGRLHG